jgi:hypothetical protein
MSSEEVVRTHVVYQGPFGLVVCEAGFFSATKDGFPVGTYKTFGEAVESLAWKSRARET